MRKIAIVIIILVVIIVVYHLYNQSVPIQLVDPEMAPQPERELVMRGFHIMEETVKYAPAFAGARLNCSNCHFNAGNSWGGTSNGIALVGVSYKYPHFSDRDKKIISLEERIDNCFQRSLNGKSLPAASIEMKSLVAYFNWISTPIKKGAPMPWLGLKHLKSKHVGNMANGEILYNRLCADCHGKDGNGKHEAEENSIPPLWGEKSFNSGAGMAMMEMFTSFIHANMPLGEPTLTEEQAIDIGTYVLKQSRPQYKE